jgi:hypothetical protein
MQSSKQQEVAYLKTHSGAMWALRAFSFIAYATNILVNYLGAAGYFGETNADVSAKYPTILTPAGYAFAIWGLIFLLQGVYVLYGLLSGDDDKLRYIALLGVFVPLGWVGEAVWTPIFNFELIPISIFFISGSCLFFLTAYLRVTAPESSVMASEDSIIKKVFYYLIFEAPTALNFGWLVVATIVNGLIVLKYFGIDASVTAGIGLIAAANVLAAFFLVWRREVVVALVQIWAITAIAVNQTDATLKMACYTSVSVLTFLVVAVLVVSLFVSLLSGVSSKRRNAEAGYQLTDMYYATERQ